MLTAPLQAALQAEVDAYIAAIAEERDENGRRLVVRNGSHAPRKILTAAGTVKVKAPRVNDKRIDEQAGERQRFSSAILPTWARKSPQISEVLSLLYLHGFWSTTHGGLRRVGRAGSGRRADVREVAVREVAVRRPQGLDRSAR
jgi:hypothetical protein